VGKILVIILLLLAVVAGWLWISVHHPYQGFPGKGYCRRAARRLQPLGGTFAAQKRRDPQRDCF